jgi:hypothetical protein
MEGANIARSGGIIYINSGCVAVTKLLFHPKNRCHNLMMCDSNYLPW